MDAGDDDFYGPDEPEEINQQKSTLPDTGAPPETAAQSAQRDDLEEGEEEDEGGEVAPGSPQDNDPKDGGRKSTSPPPAARSKYSEIRNIPSRTAAGEFISKAPSVGEPKAEIPQQPTSSVDINANPIYKAAGKPIVSVGIDEDLAGKEKPWRNPGTDISDYFNYGFDEFSWTLYSDKQSKLRSEYSQEAMNERTKKMMDEMSMMMMPGMGGPAGNMAGMDAMGPDMQSIMQQMMASGIDPSQMDPSAMAAVFNAQAGGGQNHPSFGGQPFAPGQGQGYDAGGGGSGMNHRGGYGGGRGNRGNRRNW